MGHTLSKEQASLALAYAYDEEQLHHQHQPPLDDPTNRSAVSIALPRPPMGSAASSIRSYSLDNAACLKRSYTHSGLNRFDSAYGSSEDLTNVESPHDLMQEELLKDLAYVNKTYYPSLFSDHEDSNEDEDNEAQQKLEDMMNDITQEYHEFEKHADPKWKPIAFGTLTQLQNIDLSASKIVSLSPNIGLLHTVTHLNLSNNRLTMLPRTLGHLKNLIVLDVSQNNLRVVPDTISYLSKLIELNLSNNKLTKLPYTVGGLKKLQTFLLNDNQVAELPTEIGLMKSLTILDLSNNPLKVLPAELSRLQFLRRMRLDGCPFVEEFVHELAHKPPTLLELCARTIVRHQVPILASTPDDIKDYIASAKTCSFCGGPYFQSFVKRGKIVEKPDQVFVPLEYRLCAAHWNDESERIRLMFAPLPDTAPPSLTQYRKSHRAAHGATGTTTKKASGSASSANRMSALPAPTNTSVSLGSVPEAHGRRRGSITVTPSPQTVPVSSLTKKPSLPTIVVKHDNLLPPNFVPATSSSSSSSSTSDTPAAIPLSRPEATAVENAARNGFPRWRTSSIRGAMKRGNSRLLHLGDRFRLSQQNAM